MAVHVAQGGRSFAPRTEHVTRKGYAKSRVAYDRRRRGVKLDQEGKEWARIVKQDPCSYCGGSCGQMAADHIDALNAGGRNEWGNLTGAGRPCNAAKKSKPLLWFLLERPLGS